MPLPIQLITMSSYMYLFISAILLFPATVKAELRISIDSDKKIPVIESSIHDTINLLKLAFPDAEIGRNYTEAGVRIQLPSFTMPSAMTSTPQEYRWSSSSAGNVQIHSLETTRPESVSYALVSTDQRNIC